ncbi:MAG: hypothetical protein A2W85_07150 [Bacteroidetes bacterium GWF2_41_31]|jgi:hypothetical protein|nr:MAG: hypothetical protein A2W85_07150 [Bacteroidetes bacterium GWF2_41_31]OFZ09288.1 MAG: hypothetical protein A2338_03655 [Bacteroidetes bacterium RIFOXYB12_FULL_41_6]PIQ25250.1 MAG: hypothetical protein COW63_19145 [Bacteroidetes bacterium CG18_big_fil_WC_8_21_14_2_50_41_14]PIY34734.1 MAG: hypothetical protein COZ08_00275 [Bacteroidetes bacterium CG_4_10_14_3_um_filter_42_6]PJB59571.1 MAG: hypothetical protein CO098_02690 [Bacteroidetes bacterium CG_4_9_14_3_um_filter_41_19]PKP30035.1 MAG
MKTSKLNLWIMLAMSVLLVTSCTPGSEEFVEQSAGFFMGLWHGFISFFTFIISLFSDQVGIYETNNNGALYNLGFILGISIFYGGGTKGTCGRRR